MSLWSWLHDRIGQRARPIPGESDAPADTGTARTRATGGVEEPRAADTNSTTGTTASDEFVGQASGDDAGDSGPSGAEVRGRQQGGGTDPSDRGSPGS